MSTAMAKALVDGLYGEGVEQIWTKLNRRNKTGTKLVKPVDDNLFLTELGAYIKGG